MLTSEQIRAARAMLRIEQTTLAEISGVSVESIRRFEKMDGEVRAQETTLASIKRALEAAGVVFMETKEDSRFGGPGVRLAYDDSVEEWNRQVKEVALRLNEEIQLLRLEDIAAHYVDDVLEKGIIPIDGLKTIVVEVLREAEKRLLKDKSDRSELGLLRLMASPNDG